MEQIKALEEHRPQGQSDIFYVKLHVQDIIKKNTAALSGELAAWEAEAEQPGSEEIAPVSCIH